MIPMDLGSWMTATVAGDLVLALPVAVLAGLLSFFSPCVLPLLPAYLSYATGQGAADIVGGTSPRRRMLLGSFLFFVGFAVVFVITGAIFGGIGQVLTQHRRTIEVVAGLLCIVLGLMFADVITWGRVTVHPARVSSVGVASAPLLGAAFAIGWSPCVGPTLGVVLSLSMNSASSGKGALLAFFYALGMGVPFIVAGVAFQRLAGSIAWIKRHMRVVQLIGGGVLVVVGVLLVAGWWTPILHQFQNWGNAIGVRI